MKLSKAKSIIILLSVYKQLLESDPHKPNKKDIQETVNRGLTNIDCWRDHSGVLLATKYISKYNVDLVLDTEKVNVMN